MRKAILAGLLPVLLAAGAAQAAYISNYMGWAKLGPQEKLAYVKGLNDASSVVETGDAYNPVQAARVRGRAACLSRDQVTDQMLVALIDTRYQSDPSAKALPPMVLYERETYRICRQDIDAAVDETRPGAAEVKR